jgi:DNA repair protein RadD
MAISFQSIINRADELLLNQLVEPGALSLIKALEPTALRPSSLRAIIVGVRPPEQMMREQQTRGLLLSQLKEEERIALLSELKLGDWKEVLTARPNSRTVGNLLQALGIIAMPLPTSEPAAPSFEVEPHYGLFEHQRRAASEACALLESANRKVILHMPTGSGKTRTAMSIICKMLREREDGLVVWLATSEELCEQATREFELAWQSHGNRTVSVRRLWGTHATPAVENLTGIVFVGLQRLNAIAQADIHFVRTMGYRSILNVFDEAHQSIAPTYRARVESLIAVNSEASLLGLTATPGRTWNMPGEDRQLADFFAGQKVTLTIAGHDSPISYLIQEKYLANPTFRTIEDATSQEWTSQELSDLAVNLEVPSSVLQKLANQDVRNLSIVREIRNLAARHDRIMVFAATVQHASVLAITLQAIGIDARSVSGSTATSERESIIEWYKSDFEGPRVLTNFGVLTAGFDAPKTSAVLIARPLKSLVLYSQMVGRALRGVRAGGNLEAEVVTVVDTTLPGFGQLSDAFNNWEDVWRPTR